MREGQVPRKGQGLGSRDREKERERERERQTDRRSCPCSERSFFGCLEGGVPRGWTRADPTGRTPGVGG